MARNEPCVCQPGEGLGNTMNDQCSGTQAEEISAEIAALAALDLKDMKSRWRELYDTEPPPRISRELLTRAIAYRLQEREFGGLAPSTLPTARTRRRRPVTSPRETKSGSQSSSRYLAHSRVAG